MYNEFDSLILGLNNPRRVDMLLKSVKQSVINALTKRSHFPSIMFELRNVGLSALKKEFLRV